METIYIYKGFMSCTACWVCSSEQNTRWTGIRVVDWLYYQKESADCVQDQIKVLVADSQVCFPFTKNAKESIDVEKNNGNTLWWDSQMKEMNNAWPSIDIYEGSFSKLVGY